MSQLTEGNLKELCRENTFTNAEIETLRGAFGGGEHRVTQVTDNRMKALDVLMGWRSRQPHSTTKETLSLKLSGAGFGRLAQYLRSK